MQPHSDWEELDFLMFEAYEIALTETSGDHGLPLWLARSNDPTIGFEIETAKDPASAMLQDWDEKQSKKDVQEKGVSRFVVPMDLATGKPLVYGGLDRERWLKEMGSNERPEDERFDDEGEEMYIDRIRPIGGYDLSQYVT